jgi:hypothetical protein
MSRSSSLGVSKYDARNQKFEYDIENIVIGLLCRILAFNCAIRVFQAHRVDPGRPDDSVFSTNLQHRQAARQEQAEARFALRTHLRQCLRDCHIKFQATRL